MTDQAKMTAERAREIMGTPIGKVFREHGENYGNFLIGQAGGFLSALDSDDVKALAAGTRRAIRNCPYPNCMACQANKYALSAYAQAGDGK